MSKIFIAGAAGNLGSALVAEMRGKADLVAGVHSPEKSDAMAGEGVEVRTFDFNDVESLIRAMDGCDRLFLALPMVEKMTRYGRLTVDAAKKAGIEYIVRSSGYASSSDAHWRLGREHGMVDQFVEDSEIPFTVLRPNSFMQNFSGSLAGMIRSGVIALPEEDASVSYLDVRDIAACASRLLLDNAGFENSFYALTGPEGLTLTQVAETIAAVSGRDVSYSSIPEEEYMAALREAGVPEWNVNMLVSLTRVIKLGMAGNVTKAVEYITGTPARTFGDFAGENASVWK